MLWGTSLLPGKISKEGKPIVPIHPHLKQVPAKPWISKLFSHERHHHHYRKQHPEAAGDPCPVPTSHNKTTPETVYFKLLPHEVTKMIVRVGHGSPEPVQDSPCASLNASSPSQSTAWESVPSMCPGDLRLSQHTIPEMDSSKGSLFGKASFMQGYQLLISAKEKEHHHPL